MVELGQVIGNGIITQGAGIVALVLLFVAFIWLALKIPGFLKAISDNTATSTEVIRNNSSFIQEMAKSNENVAKALEMLSPMYDRTLKVLEEHDARAQIGWAEVMKISERTAACRTRSTDPR